MLSSHEKEQFYEDKMVISVPVVIIFLCLFIWNHHVVHLKNIQIVSKKFFKKWEGTEEHYFHEGFHLLAVSTSSWPEARQVHFRSHTATTTSAVIDVYVIVTS